MQYDGAVGEFVGVVRPDVVAAATWNYIVADGVAATARHHNAGHYADCYNRDLGAVAAIVFVDCNDPSVVEFHVRAAVVAVLPKFAVFAVVAVFRHAVVLADGALVRNAVDVLVLAEPFVVHVVAAKLDAADFAVSVVAHVADVFVGLVIVGLADVAARVAVAKPDVAVRVPAVVFVVPADFVVVETDVVLCAVGVPDFENRSALFVAVLLSLYFSEHM